MPIVKVVVQKLEINKPHGTYILKVNMMGLGFAFFFFFFNIFLNFDNKYMLGRKTYFYFNWQKITH